MSIDGELPSVRLKISELEEFKGSFAIKRSKEYVYSGIVEQNPDGTYHLSQ